MSDPADIVAFENQIVRWDLVPAEQLLANPKNYRTHPPKQRAALVGSLRDLGIIAPVLVNLQTGLLIDGHARVEQILEVDPTRPVPVAYVDLSPEQEAKAIAIFDRITDLAEVDKGRLEDLLHQVRSEEPALQKLLEDMAREHKISLEPATEPAEDPGADIDKAEELWEKWGTTKDQIWQAGRHRIACGDCRDTCCLDALMHGRKAEVLWTDPPYGVSYIGKTKDALTIENDGAEDLASLLGGGLCRDRQGDGRECPLLRGRSSRTAGDGIPSGD